MLPKKTRVIINIYIRSKYRDKEEIMVLHALVIVGASIAASLISEGEEVFEAFIYNNLI